MAPKQIRQRAETDAVASESLIHPGSTGWTAHDEKVPSAPIWVSTEVGGEREKWARRGVDRGGSRDDV